MDTSTDASNNKAVPFISYLFHSQTSKSGKNTLIPMVRIMPTFLNTL